MPVKFDSRPLVLRRAFTATMRATMVVSWREHLNHTLHLFFVIAACVIARNVANQQVLDAVGPQVLGKLYFSVAIVAGLSVAGIGWFGRNYDARQVTAILHVAAAALMAAAFLLPADVPGFAIAKYIGLEIMWSMLLLGFGMMLGAGLGPRTARRAAARIGAGGIIGGLVGGGVLTVGAPLIGSNNLYLIGAALAVAPVFFLPTTRRAAGSLVNPDNVRDRADVRELAPYGRWVAVTTLLMVAATTLIDFQYRSSAKAFYDADDMTAFFGFVVILAGCTTVAFQLTLLDKLLDRMGLFSTAVVMPGALIISAAAFGLAPALPTLILLKLVDSGANMSVQQATGGLLLAPMGMRARAVWQGRIDGLAKRGGQAITGLFLALVPWGAMVKLDQISTRVLPITLGVCVLWILAIMVTRSHYIRLLTGMLSSSSGNEAEVQAYDGATLRLLEAELADAPPARAAVILDLMEAAEHPAPKQYLRRIAEVDQNGALLVIDHLRNVGDSDAIRDFTRHRNPRIAGEALLALDEVAPNVAAMVGRKFLANERLPEELRALAAGLLAAHNQDARERVFEHARSETPETRYALARALGRMHPGAPPEIGRALCQLAQDEDVDTARTALASVGKHLSPEACDVALRGLRHRRLRGAAMRALADLGAPVVNPVAEALRENLHDPAIASPLTWALGRIGVSGGIAPLLDACKAPHPTVRLSAAVALTTLKRRRPKLEVPEDAVKARFLPEIEHYRQMREGSLCDLPNISPGIVLRRTLRQRAQASQETLFRLMSLVYPEDSIQGAFQAITSRAREQRQLALELLDTLLETQVRQALAEAIGEGGRRVSRPRDDKQILRSLVEGSDDFIGELAEMVLIHIEQEPGRNRRRDTMRPSMVDQILELQSLSIFSQASAEDLSEVASLVQERQVAKNQVIFREGEAGDAMYIIRAGQVTLSRADKKLDKLGPGDAFGIVAVLDRLPRELTATASTPSSLLVLKGTDLQQLLADRPLLMHSVFRALTEAIRGQVDRVALGKRED